MSTRDTNFASAWHACCRPAGMCCVLSVCATDRQTQQSVRWLPVQQVTPAKCADMHVVLRVDSYLWPVCTVPTAEVYCTIFLKFWVSCFVKIFWGYRFVTCSMERERERERLIWRIAYYSLNYKTDYCKIILLLRVLTTLVLTPWLWRLCRNM